MITCAVVDVLGVVTVIRRAVDDESSHHLQKKVRDITFIHSSVIIYSPCADDFS